MKAILFYTTALLIAVLFTVELPILYTLSLVAAVIVMLTLCYNILTIRDLVKYSGYKFYYKHFLPRKERPYNLEEVDLGL